MHGVPPQISCTNCRFYINDQMIAENISPTTTARMTQCVNLAVSESEALGRTAVCVCVCMCVCVCTRVLAIARHPFTG